MVNCQEGNPRYGPIRVDLVGQDVVDSAVGLVLQAARDLLLYSSVASDWQEVADLCSGMPAADVEPQQDADVRYLAQLSISAVVVL